MARPATKPVKLREGYYIEIFRKGTRNGMKLRRDTIDQIKASIKQYQSFYDVEYLGFIKNGKVIDDKLPD